MFILKGYDPYSRGDDQEGTWETLAVFDTKEAAERYVESSKKTKSRGYGDKYSSESVLRHSDYDWIEGVTYNPTPLRRSRRNK